MIVIDTSALVAIMLAEPAATSCIAALDTADSLLISAATLTETLIVAHGRGRAQEMSAILGHLLLEIIVVTEERARQAAEAYSRWGKGNHTAALNFGDCFAYALAKERDCPLLFIGNDFARTDVRSAL